ncbi:MAG: hypothetical protein IKX87_03855 [Lachnospiraceae bacterium]|nr:hypothetical protein [Lachnospiraceae bacterium]
MKKGSRSFILLAVMIMMMGFLGLFSNRNYIETTFKGNYKNVDDVLFDESINGIPNGYYELSMDAAFGGFADMKENGKVTKTYYVVWLDDDTIAAVAVYPSDQDKLDAIVDATWEYIYGNSNTFAPIPYAGVVKAESMGAEVKKYYHDLLDEMNITDNDFTIREVLLDYTNGSGLKHNIIVSGVMVLVGLLVLVIGFIVRNMNAAKANKSMAVDLSDKYLVSYKEAEARITEEHIRKCYNKLKIWSTVPFSLTGLLIVATAGMYAYKTFVNPDFSTETITAIWSSLIVFIVCGVVFGFSALSKLRHMINGLRLYSDSEYSMIEREMASSTTKSHPQGLFLTENYIVMLEPYSAYKDTTDVNNVTLFARYKDITWMYPTNHYMNGVLTNSGIAVCGPKFGKSTILGLPAAKNRNGEVENIYNLIAEKCPGALMGYTMENQMKAKQMILDI